MTNNSEPTKESTVSRWAGDGWSRVITVWMLLIATLWLAGPIVKDLLMTANTPRTVSARGELANFERVSIDLFATVAPSVAYIYTQTASRNLLGPNATQAGTGSGFVWDGAGHVVTNNHVIAGANKISVQLDSGETMDARLVGAAPDYDLAVLKLVSVRSNLIPIAVGESADLKVGQSVFAIGNPFGLGRSLSTGVISALDRHLPTAGGRVVHGAIQTDAAINPGNSGGPLLDSAGRLIGVSTAIISGSGSSAGVGFAVPVDVVNQIVPQLIADGAVPRPGIGISVLDEAQSARLGIPGVIIAAVFAGSAAQAAGLKGVDRQRRLLGDTIVSVDGRRVQSIADLADALQTIGIGNTVTLNVLRDGKTRTVNVKVLDIG